MPVYGGVVLQRGTVGPDVALVQTWLNGLHKKWSFINTVSVDGKFGPATEASVRQFQTLEGIKIDGKVGRDTWDHLYSEYSSLYGAGEIFPGISLRRGQLGSTVKSAQMRLKATVPSLVADGIFGAKTYTATQAFQAHHNLTADGIIGKKTWAALYGKSSE